MSPPSTVLARRSALAAAIVIVALAGTVATAQYALDRNQRISTQVSGIGAYAGTGFGQRNQYAPTVSGRSRYTRTLNNPSAAYSPSFAYTRGYDTSPTYNPQAAFSQPTYRPTGARVGSARIDYRVR